MNHARPASSPRDTLGNAGGCSRGRSVSPIASAILSAMLAFAVVPPHAVAQSTPTEGAPQKRSRGRWLPVPIVITEPAIGNGLGASLVYIHPRNAPDREVANLATARSVPTISGGQKRPPDVTAVVAAYTDNDTWLVGGGHSASWRADRVRYAGGLAWANVNATYYLLDRPIDFNIEGAILYQDVRVRVGSSRLFLGGKLSALTSAAEFKLNVGGDVVLPIGLGDSANVGVAAEAVYDRRDTTLTPNRGQLINLDVWRYDESFGGDYGYWTAKLKVHSFHQLSADLVLGLRFEASAASGDPPFWGYPWITLRGVPAMRYQNQRVGVVETELKWNVLRRWAAVGFIGDGWTGGDLARFEDEGNIVAGGVGARYLFDTDLGLWIGVDCARGPEDDVWYIQVGHAW